MDSSSQLSEGTSPASHPARLQNYEVMGFWCLSNSFHGILLRQPWQTHTRVQILYLLFDVCVILSWEFMLKTDFGGR